MNYDKLSKLQQIATGSVYTGKTSYENISQIRADKLKTKLKNMEKEIKDMYPTKPEKVFETWVQATKDFPMPNREFIEFYWDKYLSLHPKNRKEAKQELIDKTTRELQLIETPQEKEHFIRDNVSRWPEWLINDFKDDLQNYSTRNSDANFSKAKHVYKDDLSKRLGSISDKELDPDVSEEAHVDDILKLEKMNLMDVADAINGRFGVVGKDGSFIPAFDLQNRSQVFEKDPYGTPTTDEQLIIDDLAPDLIRNYVKGNVGNQRAKINMDNKVSESIASMMLETGSLTPDKWKEAFSMFAKPEYTYLLKKGMKGEIESGRIKSDEDIVKTLYTALLQYKDLLGGTSNGPNA